MATALPRSTPFSEAGRGALSLAPAGERSGTALGATPPRPLDALQISLEAPGPEPGLPGGGSPAPAPKAPPKPVVKVAAPKHAPRVVAAAPAPPEPKPPEPVALEANDDSALALLAALVLGQ